MPDIYRAQLQFDGVIVTPTPDPTASISPPFGTVNSFQSSIALITADGMGNRWAVLAGVVLGTNGMGNTEFRATYDLVYRPTIFAFDPGPNPFHWANYGSTAEVQDAPGLAGMGYFAGGTIAIEKNFPGNTITMITPIGSVTRTLNANDLVLTHSALNDTALVPYGHGLRTILPNDGIHSPENVEAQARFYNMSATLDSVSFFFIAMSAADPGVWFGFVEEAQDGFFGGLSPVPGPSETQAVARFIIDAVYTAAAYPAFTYRDSYRTLAMLPHLPSGVDMEYSKEHGVVWRLEVFDIETMAMQRSFDNGHSWEQFTVFNQPGANNNSPTVTWYNQKLYATWHDGAVIKEALSLDGGATWQMPITVPVTGTNPRRVIDRQGGGAFYFAFNAGALQCSISYDNGASFEGPFNVTSPVIAQQIDAEFVPNGSLLVSIFVTGVLSQFRSTDFGHTWV